MSTSLCVEFLHGEIVSMLLTMLSECRCLIALPQTRGGRSDALDDLVRGFKDLTDVCSFLDRLLSNLATVLDYESSLQSRNSDHGLSVKMEGETGFFQGQNMLLLRCMMSISDLKLHKTPAYYVSAMLSSMQVKIRNTVISIVTHVTDSENREVYEHVLGRSDARVVSEVLNSGLRVHIQTPASAGLESPHYGDPS